MVRCLVLVVAFLAIDPGAGHGATRSPFAESGDMIRPAATEESFAARAFFDVSFDQPFVGTDAEPAPMLLAMSYRLFAASTLAVWFATNLPSGRIRRKGRVRRSWLPRPVH